MKIMQFVPGKVWGGAEQYIVDMSDAMTRRGHQVVMVSRGNPAVDARLRAAGCEFRSFDFSLLRRRKAVRELAEYIAAERPDLIHVHNTWSVPIARRALQRSGHRAALVMTRHESRRSRVNPLLRSIFRTIDQIIFVSDFTRRMWGGVNSWIVPEKNTVIINSIPDNEQPEAEPLREKYAIPDRTPIIMYTGRVRKSKGCGLIIEALGALADLPWAMVFVGSCKPADYEKKLRQRAGELGIGDRVFFEGFRSDARALTRQADIGVAPSIVVDSCPLSPLEFMKEGKCVIVSDSGGQPEYVDDGVTGIIARRADLQSLIAALCTALTDSALRRHMGEQARQYFDEHLNYDQFIDRTLEVYTKATKEIK